MNWKLPVIAAMACVMAMPATAQEELRGKQAGDIVLGFSVLGVLPQSGGRVDAIGGKPDPSNSVTPQLDVTWFATPNLSLNLIAATTRHDVTVRGSALGDVDLGRVWLLPPTLTLQYHPLPQSRISPYVGAGINYTVAYNEGGSRSAAISKVDVEDSWGWALNAGVDYELSPHWAANIDVKKLFLRPDVSVNSGAIGARADLDPWIIGVGVRYRF
ncbi:OmpW family protein [Roseomonas aerophila]|uniref:OmpW family protein n=1 Tax=Teichococcus aerophilus TaxID=1224513 RepID=A0ABR7RGI7_9PROT|nr:OmpW family outer membrane protein [Pseudoroseomonas aerophila]MBC9205488.1 OmpW family protein [Pseudoroseomonas aerophila]